MDGRAGGGRAGTSPPGRDPDRTSPSAAWPTGRRAGTRSRPSPERRPTAGSTIRATGGPRTPIPRPRPVPRQLALARRARAALAMVAALVFVLTGTAWGLYRDITAGITTTDVIAGGGDDGSLTILLVGVDSRTDAKGDPLPPEVLRELRAGPDTGVLNSDTIMVLHVPEGGGAPVGFSVPRDAYVDIPGHRRDKINAAYPATKAKVAEELLADGVRDGARVEAEAAQAGRSTLIRTVEGLTGLTVDHYAEVNLVGFYNLTTAIGGVDVCLNEAVDDELSGARFPAGPQTISGGDALAFVRQRHGLPEGDLSRIRRQQVFLAAVADKVLSRGTLTDPGRLAALAAVARESLVIDEGWDVLAFAQQASDIAAGNLEFLTIPTRGRETNDRGSVVLVDPGDVREFVENRIVAREPVTEAALAAPSPPPSSPSPPSPPPPSPSPPPSSSPPSSSPAVPAGQVVDVRNGSGVAGLASAVATRLGELGSAPRSVANTGPSSTTAVYHSGSDGDGAARAVAGQLGGAAVEGRDDVRPGRLLVVLGTDFDPSTVLAADGSAQPAGVPAAPPASVAPAGPVVTAAGVRCID